MAKLHTGHTWVSGETVTPEKLNNTVAAATVEDIVNDDIAPTAAIQASKLDLSSLGLRAWASKTSNYTAAAGDRINANTTSTAFTITLPASPAVGAEVTLADPEATWRTKPLTVARNGSNIHGLAEDLTCDQSSAQIVLRYESAGTGWRIYT